MPIAHYLDCEQNFIVAKHFSDMLFFWHKNYKSICSIFQSLLKWQFPGIQYFSVSTSNCTFIHIPRTCTLIFLNLNPHLSLCDHHTAPFWRTWSFQCKTSYILGYVVMENCKPNILSRFGVWPLYSQCQRIRSRTMWQRVNPPLGISTKCEPLAAC